MLLAHVYVCALSIDTYAHHTYTYNALSLMHTTRYLYHYTNHHIHGYSIMGNEILDQQLINVFTNQKSATLVRYYNSLTFKKLCSSLRYLVSYLKVMTLLGYLHSEIEHSMGYSRECQVCGKDYNHTCCVDVYGSSIELDGDVVYCPLYLCYQIVHTNLYKESCSKDKGV